MKTFPIMLSGAGLRAVVVGSGPVGLRKARALLRAGAAVTLIDPAASARVAADSQKGLRVIRQAYRPSFLAGSRLVMACTDDRQVNHRIAADARKAGALVNAADQPEDCDFYLPAVVADGDVVVAIGTGGLSPALAASLKRRLAATLPKGTGRFAAMLAGVRRELRRSVADPRRRMAILRRLAEGDVFEEFVAGGRKAVAARIRGLLRGQN